MRSKPKYFEFVFSTVVYVVNIVVVIFVAFLILIWPNRWDCCVTTVVVVIVLLDVNVVVLTLLIIADPNDYNDTH